MASAGLVGFYIFPLLLVVAGTYDVMCLRIPNWVVVVMTILFFALASFSPLSWFSFGLHLVTAVALLCTGYALFALGIIGGGDAKLLAAVGLWLGFPVVLPFLLFAALSGGVLAVGMGLWSAIQLEIGARGGKPGQVAARLAPDLPYGFAIVAGAILAFPYSWWTAVSGGQT